MKAKQYRVLEQPVGHYAISPNLFPIPYNDDRDRLESERRKRKIKRQVMVLKWQNRHFMVPNKSVTTTFHKISLFEHMIKKSLNYV